VVYRLEAPESRRSAPCLCWQRINGAVGKYNGPPVCLRATFRLGRQLPDLYRDILGWAFNPYNHPDRTHDYIAELFDAVRASNTILIDFDRG